MEAVTYIDSNRDFKTFRFSLLRTNGIGRTLMSRLKYAHEMLESKLIRSVHQTRTNTGSTKGASARPAPPAAGGDAPGVALAANNKEEGEDAVATAVAAGKQAAANALAAVDALKRK